MNKEQANILVNDLNFFYFKILNFAISHNTKGQNIVLRISCKLASNRQYPSLIKSSLASSNSAPIAIKITANKAQMDFNWRLSKKATQKKINKPA
ncbi:hypothetical protein [Acinetobacter ursingii]|uniref:hypothetical protein n=2 Tax=Acinetobacter ursingii TaxID=108980 RepID=UPI00148D18EE|nr:hypothetical protein [Acinetobacter ursingii]MCU4351624.1 hypothetical protein [Acinetobacter ursingii]